MLLLIFSVYFAYRCFFPRHWALKESLAWVVGGEEKKTLCPLIGIDFSGARTKKNDDRYGKITSAGGEGGGATTGQLTSTLDRGRECVLWGVNIIRSYWV